MWLNVLQLNIITLPNVISNILGYSDVILDIILNVWLWDNEDYILWDNGDKIEYDEN